MSLQIETDSEWNPHEEHERTIESLRQQLAEKNLEIERLKTVPMKYRRMAFNAQLQDENNQLSQQLAEKDAEIATLQEQIDLQTPREALKELQQKLAASQLQNTQLRGVLERIESHAIQPWAGWCSEAITLPQDASALDALIAKAGEVMRERCADSCETSLCDCCYSEESQATGQELAGNIRALPSVTLEDLKRR